MNHSEPLTAGPSSSRLIREGDNRILRLFSVMVIAGFCCLSARATEPGKLDLKKMDRYIEEARQMWLVPGMSVAIVKDDSVIFARGYGVREYGGEDRVDPNTVFSIASITKTFTSAALAVMDDEGALDWDDRVQEYLPDFQLYDPYVSREIRIRDLLCHRSGLGTFSGDLIWYETEYGRAEVLRRARYLKQANGFRYGYGYSNICFLAAGEIAGKCSGKSWEAIVQQRMLEPLEMHRTTLDLEGIKGDPNAASPHYVDLLAGSTVVMPYMSWDNVAPAASMNSSAMDLSNWLRFHLGMGEWQGEQLISRENLWETRKLHTPQSPDLQSSSFWPSRHFAGYGLGWDMYDYHGAKVIGHEGGSDGMLARIVLVPEENFGFVLLTNSISAITIGLEYYILDQYFEGESYDWCNIYRRGALSYLEREDADRKGYLARSDRSIKPSLRLRDYEGIYSCSMYGDVEVRREKGRLLMDFLPSERMYGELDFFSGDTFLIELDDFPFLPRGMVRFAIGEKGGVEGMAIDIPNPDFDFTELDLKRAVGKE